MMDGNKNFKRIKFIQMKKIFIYISFILLFASCNSLDVEFPDFTYQVTVSTLSGASDTSRYKQVEMAVVNSVLDMSVSLVTIVSIKQDPS